MPEATNLNRIEQRRERDSTRFDEETRLDFHQSNLESLAITQARKEALGAAAFTKIPLEIEQLRLAEIAVEGIIRSGAWIEYARKDYLDRHWNLEDRTAA